MPFKSGKQRRFLFARFPAIAEKFVKDAKAAGKPVTEKRSRRKAAAKKRA